jgi:hypothetical protein
MIYKVRAILDVEKDVIRDILIDSSNNLEDLHKIIAKAFGFNGQEMASFYTSDTDWNQGEEIPLFDMSDAGESSSMQSHILKDTLQNKGDKLIYVYDFMSMWTFYIELSDNNIEESITAPKVAFAFGDAPEEAPEKAFEAEIDLDDEEEFDNLDIFDNIDDFDF